MADPEIRSVPFEVRAASDGLTLEGLAAVFNSPTTIFERGKSFVETVTKGAFARTINARDRILMQFDHGQHPFFGELPIGAIRSLEETDAGLYVVARLNDSWMTEPIRSAIQNEAITGMSFRFSVPEGGDTWTRSGGVEYRQINEVKLYELGPVTTPAYEATTVGVRSALGLLTDEQRAELLGQTPKDGAHYIVSERGPTVVVPPTASTLGTLTVQGIDAADAEQIAEAIKAEGEAEAASARYTRRSRQTRARLIGAI